MQINPQKIIYRNIIKITEYTKPQQNGIDCTINEEVILEPKSFKNVLLNETVDIPENIFATTNVRSSYSRKGIFISSGLYDSGYRGVIGCSIYNLSNETIIIPKNERILQMIFWEGNSAGLYEGYYNTTTNIDSKIK